jgi:DNA repair exonuclease SbcCD ATPase subunit
MTSVDSSTTTTNIDSKITEIRQNITKLETELKSRQKTEENNLKIQNICEESAYNLEDISSIQEFSLELKNLKTYYYENTSNETKLAEIQLKIENQQYSTIILNTEKQLNKLALTFESVEDLETFLYDEEKENEMQKELHELYQLRTKFRELLKAKNVCQSELSSYTNNTDSAETSDELFELINNLKVVISELDIQKQNTTKNIELIEKYKTYEKEQIMYDEMVLKIQESKIQEKAISKDLSSACVLKQLILEAESISVLNIISSINTHAQGFLDTFFEDPISIRLIPFKETKGGNKKPQINVEVHYKGMEAELSMLSGGELSRVVLAFMLALVEIFNSPIVLLDECTSSLDENLNTEVIESIKTTFQNKLIIMISHQCVAGNYDKIIELYFFFFEEVFF